MTDLKIMLILVFSFCVYLINLKAQSNNQASFSVQLNLQHQDIPINFDLGQLQKIHNILIRPYTSVDIQYNFKENRKKQRFIQAHIGYFYNQYSSRYLATNLGYGKRYSIKKRLAIIPSFEIGVALARDQTIEYTYENEKWLSQSNADLVSLELILKPRLDFSYKINSKLDILVTSHALLLSDDIFPMIPYYGIGIGSRYTL